MAHNITFSLIGATGDTYTAFINALRERLVGRPVPRDGGAVLRSGVRDSERFILVDLSNYNKQTITVAIDVTNIYVVGHRVGNNSFFVRQDVPNVPIKTLFPGTTRVDLPYTGNYPDLERPPLRDKTKTKTTDPTSSRSQVELGPAALDNAISFLQNINSADYAETVRKQLLVIIQMVSEAARFRYIESQIREKIVQEQLLPGSGNFKPGPETLSLENHWGDLSEQIQRAPNNNGKFFEPVKIQGVNNLITVDNLSSKVVKGIALLLFYNAATAKPGGSGGKRDEPKKK